MKRIAVFGVVMVVLEAACSAPSAESLATVFVSKLLGCVAQPDPVPEVLTAFYVPLYKEYFDRRASAKGSGFTPEKMSACAEALEKLSCEDLTGEQPAACRPPGSLATGASCFDDSQCQGAYCRGGDPTSCGVCITPATIDQPCTTESPCDRGLACRNGRCLARVGIGGACGTATGLCRSGLSCVNSVCVAPGIAGDKCALAGTASCGPGLTCRNNLCVGLLRSGQTCDPAITSKQCSEFYRCDATSKQCTTFTAVKLGESCSEKENKICAQGYCAMSGKCEAFLEDGQACVSGATTGCKPFSSCRGGVCVGAVACPPDTPSR